MLLFELAAEDRSDMSLGVATEPLCRLKFPVPMARMAPAADRAARAVESALALDLLNELHADCAAGCGGWREFLHRVLSTMQIRWKPPESELARIPREGPLVVVANHPFGALEGIILAAILAEVRPDLKVMANFMLGRIKELRDLFIFVDPFAGENAAAANVGPLRQSIRQLRDGGVLAVFPAGEVASVSLRNRNIADPPWNTTIARIIRATRSAVVPVYFEGHNSALFHALGLIHPRLRTAMLAREFFWHKGDRVQARIGSVIPFKRLVDLEDADQLTAYLRQRTYLLRHRDDSTPQRSAGAAEQVHETIVAPVEQTSLQADVASLPAEQLLADSTDLVVYQARAGQIPNILREIGRLREITFRATGEGTGKSIDLDRFDQSYVHLFVWNRAKAEVVGAYRLGLTDELLRGGGSGGLYTSTLFKCKSALLRHISPALELGRSFVRAEYQKSFSPLLMLWKGIGEFVAMNPRYRYLFGPVSISNTYQSVSKQLMVRFLREHHCPPELVDLAKARNPFRLPRLAGWDRSAFKLIRDSDDVSDVINDLDPRHRGIPVLLRQYLKMGAKLLAFNVDPGFGDCVDALMVCDLTKADPRMLERYMGKESWRKFLQHHRDRVYCM
jgi:putative hemolysin